MKIHEYGYWTEVANYHFQNREVLNRYLIAGHHDPIAFQRPPYDDGDYYSTRWIIHGTYYNSWNEAQRAIVKCS